MGFSVDEIEDVSRCFFAGFGHDAEWDRFRRESLDLPEWFDPDLDPFSQEYHAQQIRLWQVIAGEDRAYDPATDENMVETSPDLIRLPGYFKLRNPGAVVAAGNHLRATGAILANSNLDAGQWALEYGAGYGLIALNFARLGVNVDTVDISEEFCGYVKQQADFYRVPLTAFNAQFGANPRGRLYDLIYFYESFHHCSNLPRLMASLQSSLTDGGRVILAGEPIVKRANKDIPYPWGLRLDAPTVAVVRARRWFELGFTDDFIMEIFTRFGFVGRRMEGFSEFDRGFIFEKRAGSISLSNGWVSDQFVDGWHSHDASGRWTKDSASIHLDTTGSFGALRVHAKNQLPVERVAKVRYGDQTVTTSFAPGQAIAISIDAQSKAPHLTINCAPVMPADLGISEDRRPLGLHISSIEYVG